MYLGTQYEPRDLTPDYYQHLVQLGCNHVCSTPSGHPATWTASSLTAHREKIEGYDLALDMVPLGHIGIGEGDPWRAIMLGTDDRDQALDSVCDTIRHTASAGIPAMKYYLHYLGVVSTGHVLGRGGSQNRTFVYTDAAQEPLTEAGRVDADASLQWTVGGLGSRLAHIHQDVRLDGRGAHAEVNGLTFATGKQRMSYYTQQSHQAPDTTSDLLYRNVLRDRARIVWRGMIQVDAEAQKTDSYQRNDEAFASFGGRNNRGGGRRRGSG